MSFSQMPVGPGKEILQRSLSKGRLGHAYLFSGAGWDDLETLAKQLAKTINCEAPVTGGPCQAAIDSCDRCSSCRRIDQELHPDILWIRPESKSRVITIEQIRELMKTVHLKPTEARFKVGVIQGAERLNIQAANAFLKTLEEPPVNSVLILLTPTPEKVLETITSRCLRIHSGNGSSPARHPPTLEWLKSFALAAVLPEQSLLQKYRLLDHLLQRLASIKDETEKSLLQRSPLEKYEDLDPAFREKLEGELEAAIEAEYRRQRSDLVQSIQWFLRDVWLLVLSPGSSLLCLPELKTEAVGIATRLSVAEASENLAVLSRVNRLLNSNVQEALALEVAFLKLRL